MTGKISNVIIGAARANAGQAGVSLTVFLASVLYAGYAYAQPTSDAVEALSGDSGGLDPWLLVAVAGLQALGVLGTSIKAWVEKKAEGDLVDSERLEALELENRQLREEKADLQTKLAVHEALRGVIDEGV